MLAKIIGAILLVFGVATALSLVGPVVGGLFAFALILVKVLLVLGIIYLGWRWINARSALAKIAGAFVLVVGIGLAVPAAFGVVAGTLAAIVLGLKVVVAVVMIYFGWRWLKSGQFSVPRRREFSRF